jgi:hypothetical protein
MRAVIGISVCAFLSLLFTSICSHSSAQNRIALLIGNQAYSNEVGKLRNPLNDAELVAAALKETGFEVLPLVQ